MDSKGNNKNTIIGNLIIKTDQIITLIETNVSIICFVLMITSILVGIVLRFFLKVPNLYGEEFTLHLFFLSTVLGISLAIRSRNHLGVKMFVTKLPEKLYIVIKFLTDIIIIFVYIFLVIASFNLYKISRNLMITTSSIEIPFKLIYLVVGLCFIFISFRSILMFFNDYFTKGGVIEEKGGGLLE